MSADSSNDINRESFEFCHSIPIIPYSPQLMDKYRIKTLHQSTPRPIQEISISIKEIEGLKRALLKKYVKTASPFGKGSQLQNSKYENISVLSANFPETVMFPEKGPFWNGNKEFVNNYLKLNQQKLALRQEKQKKFQEKLHPIQQKNVKNEEKTARFSQKTTQIISKTPGNLTNNTNNIRKIKSKSPFSRRFIREHSPFETVVVLQPKRTDGKICLLNF